MKTGSKVISTILSVILALVIVLAAFFAFTTLATRDKNKVANILGFTPLTVQTESMAPFFNAGDLIIIKTCDPSKLEVGDVVTFHTIIQNQYALNTHRIAEVDASGSVKHFTTKGDNNMVSDQHIISEGDVVGKYVCRLAGFGKVIDFLSSSTGFLVVIVLPMLLFFIYQVYHLIMVSIQLKKAMAAENDTEAKNRMSEAEAALAEAQRLKAEYEAKLAEAQKAAPAPENKQE